MLRDRIGGFVDGRRRCRCRRRRSGRTGGDAVKPMPANANAAVRVESTSRFNTCVPPLAIREHLSVPAFQIGVELRQRAGTWR